MAFTKAEIETLINDKLKDQVSNFSKLLSEQEKAFKKIIDEQEKKFKRIFEDQEKKLKKATDHAKDLNKKIDEIEKDLVELSKELEDTQRLAYSTDQYQRRNNVEIAGIPHDFDDNLEDVCISLINSVIHSPDVPDEDCIGTFDI